MPGTDAQELRRTCSGTPRAQMVREGEIQDKALWLEG